MCEESGREGGREMDTNDTCQPSQRFWAVLWSI